MLGSLHKKPPTFVEGLWHHPGSNRGHKDFQSFALPTELQRHRIIYPSNNIAITGQQI